MSMKRFLLFAVAALIVGSASAQLVKKANRAQVSKSRNLVSSLEQKKVSKKVFVMPFSRTPNLSLTQFSGDVRLTAKKAHKLNNWKLTNTAAKTISHRAGTVQQAYDAYGTDNQDGAVQWQMLSGATEENVLLFADVIPSLLEDDVIPVEYTIEGSAITIAPQLVLTNTYEEGGVESLDYIFLFSASSDDGVISMTLNDDNSISTDDDILYGAFNEATFTPVTSDDFDAKYTGYYEYVSKISYLLPGQTKAPVVFYEPDGLYLHMGYSPSWYNWNTATFMFLPVAAETAFLNYTEDNADTWSWSMDKLKDNAAGDDYEVDETITSDSHDFSIVTEPEAVYYQPVQIGAFNGAQSEPYRWSLHRGKEVGYVYAGGLVDYEFTDGTHSQANKCDPANRVSAASFMGTPDINSNQYNISSLIFYQGKPAAPLYFEGISLWVDDYAAQGTPSLKCKIVKVSRDPSSLRITLGDVVAEADLDTEDIFLDGEGSALLSWNSFYKEDETGLSEEVDHIQIEDEFAIMFEGWNNGSFTASPFVEYSGDMVNAVSTTSSYLKLDGDDAVYGFFNLYSHPYVSFKEAIYGYMLVDEGVSTSITVPDDGSDVALHITPMFYATNDETGEPETAIWPADDSDEIPEWLDVRYTNPTSTDDISFDLLFSLAAEGSRAASSNRASENSCHLVFEQWGSKLAVDVSRSATGISVVTNKVETAAPAYNLAGQRVNKNFKGLVVKDGRKVVVK